MKTINSASTLDDLKALVDTPEVSPDMPKIGDKALLSAVFGRMVHPTMPTTEHELDQGKITRVVFDWWHEMQWKAGKVCLAAT